MKSACCLSVVVCGAYLSLAASPVRAQLQETRTEVAANARRIGLLATAAGITAAQAATVFAQITPAPHAPQIHGVVTDTLADGARNIFGLMDIDTRRECSIEGFGRDECSDHGVQTWVFFTHVSAAGAVERTGFDLPFATVPRGDTMARAVALRLYAPAPSAPRIAFIDGRSGHGASYEHLVWVWNGRVGYGLLGASSLIEQPRPSGESANLVSVAIDEAGRRFVATSLECDGGCHCTVPRGPEDEAAQLARNAAAHPGVCTTSERVFPFPPDLHLIDDDLDADAVRGTEAEVTAAIVPDLARASGLTVAQATAVLPRLHAAEFAPRFSHFVTVVGADGARTVYGVMDDRFRDLCVLRGGPRSRYDAIRACAYETMTSHHLLTIQLSRAGEVTAAQARSTGVVAALYVVHAPDGAPIPLVELADSGQPYLGIGSFVDDVELAGGQHDGVTHIYGTTGHMRADEYVGELVAHPAGGPFVTLTRRRTACSDACPCTPTPRSLSDAHALIAARQRANNAACPVEETPYAVP